MVVGNDSDLILFGLRYSSRIPSPDLLQITNEGKALISIENIRKDIIKDILAEIKTNGINVNDFISEESIIMDFIFVIVLNGQLFDIIVILMLGNVIKIVINIKNLFFKKLKRIKRIFSN